MIGDTIITMRILKKKGRRKEQEEKHMEMEVIS
jgi:hypothetical protein